MTNFERFAPLVGRATMANLFLMSGLSKIAGPGPMVDYIGASGIPAPQLALGLAIVVEVGGGLLLLLGYRTRPVAIALALFALTTAVIFHSNFADQNQMIHFLKNVAVFGGLISVAVLGAGAVSLDAQARLKTVAAHA